MDAATKFGDGKTLPFTPCKKGYLPFGKVMDHAGNNCERVVRKYACSFHDEARQKRLQKDGGLSCFRNGELNLDIFWQSQSPDLMESLDDNTRTHKPENNICDLIASNTVSSDSNYHRNNSERVKYFDDSLSGAISVTAVPNDTPSECDGLETETQTRFSI